MTFASKSGLWGTPAEVLSRLSGTWHFERSIEGHGSMKGVATFTPARSGELAYREEGDLQLESGGEVRAQREYFYRQRGDGFAVFFKETPPRLFHEVHLGGVAGVLKGSVDHMCGQDHYLSTYEFQPGARFVIRHVVRGPRKDYTIVTSYFAPR
jgi:hypothetical protein